MKIELNRIKISELISGYKNDPENGVIGYDGKLNIRPAYQREFVYNESKGTKSNNKNLHKAKDAKKDEFYTQMVDIEREMLHYRPHFKGKTIFCNCDDPMESNFFKFFSLNFEFFGLKKLITASYGHNGERGKYLIYEGDKNGNLVPDVDEIEVKEFNGDGDFRSRESIALLKESDIVITNPPFSLFREFVAQLDAYGKDFIIIGNKNAITYKECFKMIKENKMWLGMGSPNIFNLPNGEETKSVTGLCRWFTNLNYPKRHEDLILFRKYTPEEYPKYDNYDAINVNKSCDIPMDYEGVMGVPITFLDKYNPDQFEIIKFRKGDDEKDLSINGKCPYFRILIKNKKVVK